MAELACMFLLMSLLAVALVLAVVCAGEEVQCRCSVTAPYG